MPYIGRAPSASIIKIEDADQDTKIQVEESSDEDIIRFDIAGAEDFTMTADSLNVLSGSTLNIAAGATIANSGTATGFGPSFAAVSGQLQAVGSASIKDMVIFGPAVDGVSWGERTQATTADLMVAMVQDNGAPNDSQLRVFDLSAGAVALPTPIVDLRLTGVDSPTCIAACMGYIAIGSEDGVTIVDPHDGTWKERKDGYPRSLSTSDVGSGVDKICAGFSDAYKYDPRTGGQLPVFGGVFTSSSWRAWLYKEDGQIWNDKNATSGGEKGCAIENGHFLYSIGLTTNRRVFATPKISLVEVDNWNVFAIQHTNSYGMHGLGADLSLAASKSVIAAGGPQGMTLSTWPTLDGTAGANINNAMTAKINLTYNSGWCYGDTRAIWLAQGLTNDRGLTANNLTHTGGGLTFGAAVSGSEVSAASGFDSSNYLSLANDSDFNFGTLNYWIMGWFKCPAISSDECIIEIAPSSLATYTLIYLHATGGITVACNDGSGNFSITGNTRYEDNEWHQFVFLQDQTNNAAHIYVDGVLEASDLTAGIGSMTLGSSITRLGIRANSSSMPANNLALSMVRVGSTNLPDEAAIRQMYSEELAMFQVNAKVLLQGPAAHSVIDLDADPVSGYITATQADRRNKFKGLVNIENNDTNAGTGASWEHNRMFGGDRIELNNAGIYAVLEAKDVRGGLDMLKGLAQVAPGWDMSKAKAWLLQTATGSTPAIGASFNIKSVTRAGAGLYDVLFAVPFKDANWCGLAGNNSEVGYQGGIYAASNTAAKARINMTNDSDPAANTDSSFMFVAFGELENE